MDVRRSVSARTVRRAAVLRGRRPSVGRSVIGATCRACEGAGMRRLMLAIALPCALGPTVAVAAALPRDYRLVRGGFETGRQPDGNSIVIEAREGTIIV